MGTVAPALVAALLTTSSVHGAVPAESPAAGPRQPSDAPRTPEPGPNPSAPSAPTNPAATIGGSSLCPRPEDVWAELGTLVPSDRLAQRMAEAVGPSSPVQILDLGIPYRVIAAGRVREYRDETRDCAHRARVAAVFVALALDPPVATVEPPAQIPPRPPVVAAPPAPVVAYLAHLDVGGGVDAGIGSGGHVFQPGLALRLALGRGTWGFLVGIAGSLPVDTSIGGLPVRLWRVPADIGVRARLVGDMATLYGEGGLAVAWLSERGLALSSNENHGGVEVGAFAAAGLRLLPPARLGPFIELRSEFFPSPPGILALPRGVVGHTPTVWLGATVGASIDF
jgi:hypothetical protein